MASLLDVVTSLPFVLGCEPSYQPLAFAVEFVIVASAGTDSSCSWLLPVWGRCSIALGLSASSC